MSDEDIRRSSVIRVVNRELYQTPSRNPFPYGVLDPRLVCDSKLTKLTIEKGNIFKEAIL